MVISLGPSVVSNEWESLNEGTSQLRNLYTGSSMNMVKDNFYFNEIYDKGKPPKGIKYNIYLEMCYIWHFL